jgi:2C-methyl-D-erythritol 2,4-cyclodiphosphate synthase
MQCLISSTLENVASMVYLLKNYTLLKYNCWGPGNLDIVIVIHVSAVQSDDNCQRILEHLGGLESKPGP